MKRNQYEQEQCHSRWAKRARAYQRKQHRLVRFRGRLVKAWRVPGTAEAGYLAMLREYEHRALADLKKIDAIKKAGENL